jgi:hypothetical protein
MKQWELWKFPYPSADRPHGFVILSPTPWCENANAVIVNCLLCTTLRPAGRLLRSHEVRLDEADGLDWNTVVKCAHIHELPKIQATALLGSVTTPRQREIARTLRSCLGLG